MASVRLCGVEIQQQGNVLLYLYLQRKLLAFIQEILTKNSTTTILRVTTGLNVVLYSSFANVGAELYGQIGGGVTVASCDIRLVCRKRRTQL